LSLSSATALALAVHEGQYGAAPCLALFMVGYGLVAVYGLLHLELAPANYTAVSVRVNTLP
jgi:hypothetical protein